MVGYEMVEEGRLPNRHSEKTEEEGGREAKERRKGEKEGGGERERKRGKERKASLPPSLTHSLPLLAPEGEREE